MLQAVKVFVAAGSPFQFARPAQGNKSQVVELDAVGKLQVLRVANHDELQRSAAESTTSADGLSETQAARCAAFAAAECEGKERMCGSSACRSKPADLAVFAARRQP